MINGKKVVVCMPAYNASKTLAKTLADIPFHIVDDIILVDDASSDDTFELAQQIGIKHVYRHTSNSGYGANQKTCYEAAARLGADVVVMLHPDYQYDPRIIPSMAYLVALDIFPVVLGSRILGGDAVKNGMPVYKYISNRLLTFFQNCLLSTKVSEYHTGYRAYSIHALKAINLQVNSNDFIFDNQVLAQFIYLGISIGEVSCPARYFPEASSINFARSVRYGLGVVYISVLFRLNKMRLMRSEIFRKVIN
jgi:glycosyltransferase involved in cell wall biosynthesis